jgi:hypothetical protein
VIFASSSIANDVEAANGNTILLISLLQIRRIIANIQGWRCHVNESPPAEQLWDDIAWRDVCFPCTCFFGMAPSSFPGCEEPPHFPGRFTVPAVIAVRRLIEKDCRAGRSNNSATSDGRDRNGE